MTTVKKVQSANDVNYYVIGDIAGRYETLKSLIKTFKEPFQIIGVGDLVDRGPKSCEVVGYFRRYSHFCTKGNHEDMMVDYYKKTHRYDTDTWLCNGGNKTIKSYKECEYPVSADITWLENLPTEIHITVNGKPYVIRHTFPVDMADNEIPESLWARERPEKPHPDGFMVTGHNSHWGLWQNEYGICIDVSGERKLAAYCLNTGIVTVVNNEPGE